MFSRQTLNMTSIRVCRVTFQIVGLVLATRQSGPIKRKRALKVKDRLKQHTTCMFELVHVVRDGVKTNCRSVFTCHRAADVGRRPT